MLPDEVPVIDVRRGVSQEVLDDLRRARRVVLAVKGLRAALLGYWVPAGTEDALRIALLHSDGVPPIQVPPRPDVVHLGPGGLFVRPALGGLHRARRVLLDIREPANDEFWSRLLGLLRPGDVLKVGMDPVTGGRPVLRVTDGRTTVASLWLPRRPSSQPGASSSAA